MVEFGQFSRIFYFLREKKSSTRSTSSSSSSVPQSSAICRLQTCRAARLGLSASVKRMVQKLRLIHSAACRPVVRETTPRAQLLALRPLRASRRKQQRLVHRSPEGGNMPRASLRAATSMMPCGRPLRSLPARHNSRPGPDGRIWIIKQQYPHLS